MGDEEDKKALAASPYTLTEYAQRVTIAQQELMDVAFARPGGAMAQWMDVKQKELELKKQEAMHRYVTEKKTRGSLDDETLLQFMRQYAHSAKPLLPRQLRTPTMKDIQTNAAFKAPIDTIANLWIAKFHDEWVTQAQLVAEGQEFYEIAVQRLMAVDRIEQHTLNDGTHVYRILE